jgi:serine/threonine-protein kinase
METFPGGNLPHFTRELVQTQAGRPEVVQFRQYLPMDPIILNNRYQLQDRQGAGGMAMVYRARDLMLERTVAIKLLRADYSRDHEFRERFRQEARAAANLSHPNIVTVHDFGLDRGQLFIVMEYVPGTDLKSMIQKQGRFSPGEAIGLIVQACAGIGYAHRAGLVHCDVKPQNMLVTPEQRLKVVDFGIARALASIAPEEKSEVVWGSPQYFSPEQAAGDAPSPASDVYSLGVVLFEMLTGQLPFSASSPEELGQMHRDLPPPSPRKLNPAVPSKLEQVVLKVLSKEPSARYRTADQLGRVLTTFAQQDPARSSITAPHFPDPNEAEGTRPAAHPAVSPRPRPPRQTGEPPRAVETRVSPNRRPGQTPSPIRRPVPAHPVNQAGRYTRPGSPVRPPASSHQTLVRPPVSSVPGVSTYDEPLPSRYNPLDIDWVTWLLGLLALVSVLGLVPFCLWVYYALNPPF